MRTQPITILKTKDEIKEFLTKMGAKEHFKHKGFYATPDNKVIAIKKNQYNNYSVYEVYGAVRKDGYVILYIDGTTITKHRFVMECFNGKKPNGLEIDHVNSNKQDNTLSNLMYVTHAENMRKFWREHRSLNTF